MLQAFAYLDSKSCTCFSNLPIFRRSSFISNSWISLLLQIMDQPPLPPNPDDENEDLDNRLHDIDIHEVDEDSTDSGEGSIIIMNEEEGHMEELVEADDGVVLDDRNSDDMETDDRDGEFHEMNGYLNEDRVGGNHPLIRFCEHTGIHLFLLPESL